MSTDKIKNRVWIILGVVIGLVALYYILVYPFLLNSKITSELEIEEQRLENYVKLIKQKPKKDFLLANTEKKLGIYKGMLLDGDKPPVVAAMLQNTLKQMAEDEGVNIERERPLNIEERGLFLEIPIEITLRCSITKLANIIYAIEDYEKFLDISKINISVINIRNPIDVKVTMTIAGYILSQGILKES